MKDNQAIVCARCYKETHVKGKKTTKQTEPQPPLEDIITFHRYYLTLKRNPGYKKRVTWVEGRDLGRDIVVIEYTGDYNEKLTPHGNAKMTSNGYERTDPDILNKIKENIVNQKPSDVYAQMTDPNNNESMEYPRDTKQCQNVKSKLKANQRKGRSNNNIADELMNVFQMVSDKHQFIAEVVHSRDYPLPSVICYTDDQVTDFESFLSSGEGVVGVDRTFSLGKCYVTTTVYKSHKVTRKETGEPPIFLGPLMLHWDGREHTYFRFFSHIRGILGVNIQNLEIIMGTDDEKAMTNTIDMAFPGCQRKLCTKHIKDNMVRNMTDKIPKSTKDRNEIINMIFGASGVASANDAAEFDEKKLGPERNP